MDHTPLTVPTEADAREFVKQSGLDPTRWEDDNLLRRVWELWPTLKIEAFRKKRAERADW